MAKSADAFRTISEVAEWLDTPAHVLRFWESKFSQVKPVKRAGGRRYYRPQDMMLLGGIKKLLHDDGMTIKSVQKLLRDEGAKHVATLSANPAHSGSYTLVDDAPSAEPETEVSRVVSFKPAPDTAETHEPSPAPAASEDGTLPFPSFLSGDSSMPKADEAAVEEPEATEAEADAPVQEDTTPDAVALEDHAAEEIAPEDPAPDAPAFVEIVEEPAADAAPVEDAPVAEPETVEATYEPIDIMSKLTTMTVGDIRAREAELRPILNRIRAELDRTG